MNIYLSVLLSSSLTPGKEDATLNIKNHYRVHHESKQIFRETSYHVCLGYSDVMIVTDKTRLGNQTLVPFYPCSLPRPVKAPETSTIK